MIRTFISLILIMLCSHNLFGQSQSLRERMRTAIDIGTHSVPFVYTNTWNTADYTNDYSCTECKDICPIPGNDIFYKLTLTREMCLDITLIKDSYKNIHFHVLNSSGREIEHCCVGSYEFIRLFVDTYYFVIELAHECQGGDFADEVITANFEFSERKVGDVFSCPLDLGTFDSDFSISAEEEEFINYMMDYHREDPFVDDPHCDMVHQFTITQPMEVTMENYGLPGYLGKNSYYSTLMSSQMDSISPISGDRYELDPGTYFIYSWGYVPTNPNNYFINLTGKLPPPGSSFKYAQEAGSYSSDFAYTDMYYTGYLPEHSGDKVYYRLVLTSPMELVIDNCGSQVNDTYLSVYSEDKHLLYSNDDYNGEGSCSNPKYSRIHIPALLPGTYYIVTDGLANGNVKTSIHGTSLGLMGDRLITAIDAGAYDGGFLYTDTRNTSSGYTNQFGGKPTNDVFYKLTLSKAADLLVNHCGSVVTDTYLSILNSAGTVLYSNDNYTGAEQCSSAGNALLQINDLPAGTYYIVSEGNSQNGLITTTMKARGVNGFLSTTMGQPHVISFIPTAATDDILTLGVNEVRHEIQYYDYFGKPTVQVQHGFSPLGDDIFTLQEYDGLDRATNLWLPVTRSNTNGAYVDPYQLKNAAKKFFLFGEDANPYSQTIYNGSSLNEVVEQYGQGEDWHTGNKSVKTDRLTNQSQEDAAHVESKYLVTQIYQVTNVGLSNTGAYATGRLNVTKTTDEDGHISYEFKDKSGRIVLTRQLNDAQPHDTYTVYDNYGNIRLVLPPLAVDGLTSTSSWNENNEILKKYAYIYHYDKSNRCVYKKLPGCEPIYTVYDTSDRPVFTQDGNQRDKGEWTFSIMDTFNRVVLTGTCKNTLDYMTDPLSGTNVKASLVKQNNYLKGYHLTGITLNNPTVLAANYYDTYTFLGFNSIPDTISSDSPTRYTPIPGYGERYNGGAKGLQTGSWTASLSTSGTATPSLYTVMYYDHRYRLIQQKGNNSLGGTEQTYTAYNFSGQPIQVKQERTVPGKETITETRKHTYDNASRLLQTTYQLNNDTPVTLVDNVYDEVGRLKTERRNGNSKLKTDYAYNLRSWTKSISSPLLNQTLNYQESTEGNTPCYNGNISSTLWQSGDEGIAGNEESAKGYRFTYDGLSRLKNAIYGEGNGLANNISRFNEQITGYDKMGNILGLLRYGQTGTSAYGLIDNLNLTYDGNQLRSVNDAATNSVFGNGTEFKDGANQTIEYAYDKNGNQTKDLNKNVTSIQYNLLNLPSQVSFAGGNRTDYEYAVNGSKLRTVHTSNGTSQATDYCGNAVYENGELKTLLNEAGYVSFPDKKFHFYLRDHQGNVRVVADKDGNVEEANAYYPFGGTFTSTANVQPYKYNGKELDTKNGLNWYDYGARHYDAAIGRWCVVDPMSECLHDLSSYQYAKNNPVRFTDPTGMMPVDSVKWNTFNPSKETIDLEEVNVTAASPHVRETVGGMTYSLNIFNGRRRLIGEAGLQNTHPEFDILFFARFLAGQGAKTGMQVGRLVASRAAVSKLPQSAINRGIQFAMRPDKAGHVFDNVAHNLGPLTMRLGGRQNVVAATLNALNEGGHLVTSRIVQEIAVNVGGSNVVVRFVVHDGFPKIGTMFIP